MVSATTGNTREGTEEKDLVSQNTSTYQVVSTLTNSGFVCQEHSTLSYEQEKKNNILNKTEPYQCTVIR